MESDLLVECPTVLEREKEGVEEMFPYGGVPPVLGQDL